MGSVGDDVATEESDVIVTLHLRFKPGTGSRVAETVAPVIPLTRAEAGNVDFRFFKVKGDGDDYVVFEHWKDQSALDSHWAQPYMASVFALFESHLIRELTPAEDVVYLEPLQA
jgi:quinol monooxygenase YgiN